MLQLMAQNPFTQTIAYNAQITANLMKMSSVKPSTTYLQTPASMPGARYSFQQKDLDYQTKIIPVITCLLLPMLSFVELQNDAARVLEICKFIPELFHMMMLCIPQ
jgi:hypothetical protein